MVREAEVDEGEAVSGRVAGLAAENSIYQYIVIGFEKTCHVANLLILQTGPYSRWAKKKNLLFWYI